MTIYAVQSSILGRKWYTQGAYNPNNTETANSSKEMR